jgi:transcriptional regulator with XRE-family HTH domain
VSASVDPELWSEFMEAFGQAVQKRREAQKISQETLAYTAGLSRSAIQKIERGVGRAGASSNPSLRTVLAIAQVLEIQIGELLPPEPNLVNKFL